VVTAQWHMSACEAEEETERFSVSTRRTGMLQARAYCNYVNKRLDEVPEGVEAAWRDVREGEGEVRRSTGARLSAFQGVPTFVAE
jgi:hypothetical protein